MTRSEEVTIPGDGGTPMPAFLAAPDDPGVPRPGVIVIHEIYGLTDDIRAIARRFADGGYVTLAPDLFCRGAKALCIARTMRTLRRREGQAFRDLDAARDWLAARPDVDGSRIGVAGFCMGGGFALLYAVRAPVGVAAPFYGEVPKDADALDGVAPVVASYGGRDRLFAPHGRRLERHLAELGVPHDVKIYPDAGHSFMNRHDPSLLGKIGAVGPMHVGFAADESEDAWSRTLGFFAEHLWQK